MIIIILNYDVHIYIGRLFRKRCQINPQRPLLTHSTELSSVVHEMHSMLLILSLLQVMYHSIHQCVHPSEFKCIPTRKNACVTLCFHRLAYQICVSVQMLTLFRFHFAGVQVSSKMRDAAVQCDFGPCIPNIMIDASTQCHRLHLPVSSSPVLVHSESELSDIDGQPSMDTSHYTFSPESTSS